MSVHNLAFQTGQGLRYNGKELLPRRINNQNLVYRLFHRQTHTPSPGTHFHQVRSLYTNVFPNYTVVNVEKPPCFLRKFSPDGKYFIAFSSDQTSLEIYTFQVIKQRWYENYQFMFFHRSLAGFSLISDSRRINGCVQTVCRSKTVHDIS